MKILSPRARSDAANDQRSPTIRAHFYRPLIAATLCILTGAASAQLPSSIKSTHPFLLADQADFSRLKAQLPLPPATFPAQSGSVSFTLTPTSFQPGYPVNASIFGAYNTNANGVFIRHVDSAEKDGNAQLQFALQGKSLPLYVAAVAYNVPLNSPSQISMTWNATAHTASITVKTVNGSSATVPMTWQTSNGIPVQWQDDGQLYQFNSRPGEIITDFSVSDNNSGTPQTVATLGSVDVALTQAWGDYMLQANSIKNDIMACATQAQPVTSPSDVCNVATGGRGQISQIAQQFALVYKMTGDPTYLAAAKNYADKIFAVDPSVGTEWSGGGRVSAMGFLYDWLYTEMGNAAAPNDQSNRTYRDKLADTIKDTIRVVTTSPGSDLNTMICGYQALADDASTFDCLNPPVYQGWNRFSVHPSPPPSIEQYYISGHHFSDVSEIAQGLLAISTEHAEVVHMITTAYNHFNLGFLAARNAISVDGGFQMGYAYSAVGGEINDRVLMWRKALEDTGNGPIFAGDWQYKLIYPYIYGLRNNTTFPALGDNFQLEVTDALLGGMALWAAENNNDGQAVDFYQKQIRAKRTGHASEIMERLLYPTNIAPIDIDTLDKSRLFSQSGQVIMRDSWDYPNATLLEFKSSSFISQNHEHMDQNSISLNYKAPLLLDSGSYETYGSTHWYNYYTRTIAHNSVIVFDPAEQFIIGSTEYSNDGGQWLHTVNGTQITYPTLEEIVPLATNALDGIVYYENTADYTYSVGNASKAYSATKLDQQNGFLRTVLFLRSATKKPISVVFDVIRPLKPLAATFLLHTINAPAVPVSNSYQSDGRYNVNFGNADARQMTVRNGGGMSTIQTLLPVHAVVMLAGGTGNNPCSQYYVSTTGSTALPPGGSTTDCRFTARQRQADGTTFLWRNYTAELSTQQLRTDDIGAWRIEISSPDTPVALAPQYFLNVISVADNDAQTGVTPLDTAVRLSADPHTEAVLLNGQTITVFNRDASPAGSLNWTAPTASAAILATGLIPNTDYTLSITQSGSNFVYALQQAAAGTGNYHSSVKGVIDVNY